ncbi:cobyric acid synthase [Nakamurella silvestris]|nr:cobyric acid synthase [Nakamurella silvestris]
MTSRGLLITGTSSDAGKSLVTTGLCRYFARQGIDVVPFKSQNMSNNSMVCADGGEIGRAQWLQAVAAGVEPETAMNPVLLKPSSDRRSHVIVRGRPAGTLEAGEYAHGRQHLAAAAFQAYRELADGHGLIVSEGAGSPAEINLRSGDYVNMGLAREFGIPTLVVGDIDRGGVFAALYGTFGLQDQQDAALIKAFVINKFRGDESILAPGLDRLTELTGRPFLGVLPWLAGVWIDGEDTLEVGRWSTERSSTATDASTLRIAAVRLPRLSNVTDLDALAAEPGVDVVMTTDPGTVLAADVVILPGSRATISDLEWLRANGLAAAIQARASVGGTVLGICGGYQMLARTITDEIESRAGQVPGLGLLPVGVRFHQDKTLRRPDGRWRGHPVRAYEIHHGRATVDLAAADLGDDTDHPFLDGVNRGSTWGTMWHGAFENDGFRRAWLTEAAQAAGSGWQPATGAPGFAQRREQMIDTLADAVAEHLDTEALARIVGL